ncbi:aspartyl-phosphate phosphatase Spo0E family protein [Bacillus sp. JCM 19041]|uniref:aspartyl-phosphate phosphatase Spo0E family protein n=1 Tax=Bacillus sp. JCM 19041 TaxID=1460637 RepID=UPI0009EBA1F0
MIHIDIEVKRSEMVMIAKKFGMTASKTVKCSQELDSLLNCLQAHRYNRRKL